MRNATAVITLSVLGLMLAAPAGAVRPSPDVLADLQRESAKLTAEVQSKERSLSATEKELSALAERKQKKEAALKLRRERVEMLMQGLVKLGSVPPEVAASMPDQYGDEVRTASVLKATSGNLRQESTKLQEELVEMASLEKEFETRQSMLKEETEQLRQGLKVLREQTGARQAMHGKLRGTYSAERKKIAEDSRKASSNVGTLLHTLDKAPPEKPATLRSFARAKGQARMPAAGRLMKRFGERDALGSIAKGITLETRKHAPVAAPYDGEVVYAGEFLGYGQMVILRHVGGFHTLLAGLESIECVPGQILLEGEPVGIMGKRVPENTSLYVEFRAKGTPIDPLPWLKGSAALAQN